MKTIILGLALVTGAAARPVQEAERVMRDLFFPEAETLHTVRLRVSEDERGLVIKSGTIDTGNIIKTYYTTDGPDGAGRVSCIDTVEGRHGPIVLAALIDPGGRLVRAVVLSHTEKRGRTIEERSFLDQFSGKKAADRFRVHGDVDGITGATVSSRAVAGGLKHILKWYAVLAQRIHEQTAPGDREHTPF